MATLSGDGIVLDCKFNNVNMLESANITERDLKVLLHFLPTVESWVLEALVGKINHNKTKLLEEHRMTYFADPNVNTDDEIIDAVFAVDGYKNRAERDGANSG